MRQQTFLRTHTNVHGGLAEPDRLHLRMTIRKVDDGHIASGFEVQKLVLRQGLTRGQNWKITSSKNRGCSDTSLQEITARDHLRTLRRLYEFRKLF